jgi:DNA-binding beta-propeller fold protein YncE
MVSARDSVLWRILAVGLLAGSASACATTGKALPDVLSDGATERVWPPPPGQPRVRLLRTVSQPSDLGIERSFWQKAWEFFAGRDDEGFVRPAGVAADASRLYVADPGAQVLWVLDPSTGKTLRISEPGGEGLVSPVSVVPGTGGRIYLADSALGQVFLLSADGSLIARVVHVDMHRPTGLAYDDARDRLYVADAGAHKVWIFSGNGSWLGAIGQRGTAPGEFNFPTHLAVGPGGDLYVNDSQNFRVQIFDFQGAFKRAFGHQGDTSGYLASPKGIAVDREGHVYLVDALFDAIQLFDREGRLLLTVGQRGFGPGEFWLPGAAFVDAQDRLFVADSYNQRVQIFTFVARGQP